MISKLGPAGPKNRDALGILRECPWAKPLKLPRPRPRVAGDAELAAIYAASIDERLPSIDGVDPAAWWQALLVAAIATDCRREALFGLEWCDVDFRTMAVTIRFENDKEDCERVKPISEILARHLLRIRAAPRPFFWPHGQRTWYQRWHAIQARAGVHARLRANHGEHYTLHEMKGAGLSRLAAFASPGVVQFMGDHASAETARHYVDLAARPEVRQAVDTLRLPENFYAGFDPPAIDAG
jgi:integrase